jgi:uncharacterized linocin/CFP29 family protein
MKYLPREAAPFGADVWSKIDNAVIGAAKSQLAGRRLLEIEGPLGFGTRVVDEQERLVELAVSEDAGAVMTVPAAIPIPMINATFSLPIRAVAAAEGGSAPMDLRAAATAAIACARLEDDLIFRGNQTLGIPGLLTAEGSAKISTGDWNEVGQPVEDIISAVNALDAAGFPGPYAAALAPSLYNALYRLYPQGDDTQLEHAKEIITGGIIKAPTLTSGGVLLATGKAFASIVVAQDLVTGFVGPSGVEFEFVVLESLVPRIIVPEAVCVLE